MPTPDLRAWRVSDGAAWNAFVESAPYHAFPQLWEWGELRRPFGWEPLRLAIGLDTDGPPLAGAQVLVRKVPVLGWRLGYAPRGPVGDLDDPELRSALVAGLRALARRERIATVKVDPEATPDSPLGAALIMPPWREASRVQPRRTRLIDLHRTEDELRSDLRRKHRQYLNKAERAGVTIEHLDGSADAPTTDQALADFFRIYAHTAERAGFVTRIAAYYEGVWQLFATNGHASLDFAVLNGERVAALFHFTCGDRATEAYGGMTDIGAESRANYLLKWEAILGFKRAGFAIYDMWGLATGGIAQFKEGFGGREIETVGARDLPVKPAEDAALRLLLPAYGIAQRVRIRLSGRHLAGTNDKDRDR